MTDTAPAEQHVANPSTVVLRLREPTMTAYRRLSSVLNAAALAANDAATAYDQHRPQEAAALRTVRDALRKAATDALIGRAGTNPTPCRRCGNACPTCSPQVPA